MSGDMLAVVARFGNVAIPYLLSRLAILSDGRLCVLFKEGLALFAGHAHEVVAGLGRLDGLRHGGADAAERTLGGEVARADGGRAGRPHRAASGRDGTELTAGCTCHRRGTLASDALHVVGDRDAVGDVGGDVAPRLGFGLAN